MNRSIVCGVDGSPDSYRALGVATEFARRLGAKLIVANVVAYAPNPVVPTDAYAPMAHWTGYGPPMTEGAQTPTWKHPRPCSNTSWPRLE